MAIDETWVCDFYVWNKGTFTAMETLTHPLHRRPRSNWQGVMALVFLDADGMLWVDFLQKGHATAGQ